VSDTLTIIGGTVRAAAQSAVRSGFSVYAADLFADEDLRQVARSRQVHDYPRGLGESVRSSQPGGWLYTGALENHARLIAEWAQVRPLLGNPAGVLRRVRNPLRVASVLAAVGFPVPAVTLDPAQVPTDGSWLIKPMHSAGGAHIHPWRGAMSQPPRSGRSYYQRCISGRPVAALYVAARKQARLLGISDQLIGTAWTGASGFRYAGSITAFDLSEHVVDRFVELGEVLARHFDLCGLFGVDALVNADGVWTVEVNPRYTASAEIVERTTGVPIIAAHSRACLAGELPEISGRPRDAIAGKAIAYATRPLVFPAWEQLPAELTGVHDGWPALADYPAAGTAIAANWPIATVLASAADSDSVLRILQQRCQLLIDACTLAAEAK
jgi:predicted ATP-grasp superfamily ATP-dependent carboligase